MEEMENEKKPEKEDQKDPVSAGDDREEGESEDDADGASGVDRERSEEPGKSGIQQNIATLLGGRRGSEDPDGSSTPDSGMYSGFRDSQYRQRGKRNDKADK